MFLIFTRKHLLWSVIFAILGVSCGIFIKLTPQCNTFAKNKICIVVDAGHGIPDGGAVGANGTVEQKINLEVAEKLAEVLEGKGMRTVMTRTEENSIVSDTSLRNMKIKDMHKRLDIIKKSDADLFISIHMNFFPSESICGLRVFYNSGHKEIKPLAESIQNKMSDVTGAKKADVKAAESTLFLMKNSPVPSILIECGFLSNKEEEKKLNDEDYQSRLAWSIADAVEKYYTQMFSVRYPSTAYGGSPPFR